MLGNIRLMFRSTTRTIQLLAIGKTADVKKYGIDALLAPVTNEINQLREVTFLILISQQHCNHIKVILP